MQLKSTRLFFLEILVNSPPTFLHPSISILNNKDGNIESATQFYLYKKICFRICQKKYVVLYYFNVFLTFKISLTTKPIKTMTLVKRNIGLVFMLFLPPPFPFQHRFSSCGGRFK